MKKESIWKIVLAVAGVLLILILIDRCFLKEGKTNSDESTKTHLMEGETVSRGEIIRLFSMLFYARQQRESLELISKYSDLNPEDEYFYYVNAAITAGIITNATMEKRYIEPTKPATCGQFRDMLWAVVDRMNLNYERLKKEFPERFFSVREEDVLYLSELKIVFEALVDEINTTTKELCPVAVKDLYVLGQSEADRTSQRFLAQNGKRYSWTQDNIEQYLDCYLSVLVCDSEIIYVKEKLNAAVTLANAFLTHGAGTEITAFASDYLRTFKTKAKLSTEFHNQIGDIQIKDGIVTGVILKPDIISGKVLLAGKEEIEVEGYGILPLDDNYCIYKTYGELSTEQTNSILVGYSITDFVVSDGKICAAIIRDKIKAENIRVVIGTTAYQSLFHSSIRITADCEYTVDNGVGTTTMQPGEEITVSMNSRLMHQGRIRIETQKEDGKISLLTVSRSYGTPKYRGAIEISKNERGLIVINEVSLEEYLYSVVPSEMPTSYGQEALKVQAVCARSYAFKQLLANRYSAYGAHVDDSVNCQVYNNVEENAASILAVKDTYGKVLTSQGEVITAYYFSTSCGYTANLEDVWENARPVAYLKGNIQTEKDYEIELSEESAFREFILSDSIQTIKNQASSAETVITFDSGYLMYRWSTTMDITTLSNQINSNLRKRYEANPALLMTYIGKSDEVSVLELDNHRIIEGMVFAPKAVSDIGIISNMQVISRGDSGIIKDLLIIGSKTTILVSYQTNIRTLLAPVNTPITRLDGSIISGMSLLPSAFCFLDPVIEEDKITAFTITGGGFGHGTGMSQNGVKTMSQSGKGYEEILQHYYRGSSLSTIYY